MTVAYAYTQRLGELLLILVATDVVGINQLLTLFDYTANDLAVAAY